MTYDVVILTDRRYIDPKERNDYVNNILLEDELIQNALEKEGLKVTRKSWDDPDFKWESTRYALFRTTWDYFDRYAEFLPWLLNTAIKTRFINSLEAIRWNIDKHYLRDLESKGVDIPPTRFISRRESLKLSALFNLHYWQKAVLKPTVSGAARQTYLINESNVTAHELVFHNLIQQEDLMLQEFQESIYSRGEVSVMIIDGKYSHAVLKKAKGDDFRVQDDFGGTVHPYEPTAEELAFAEKVVASCPHQPIYARVDFMWDKEGNPLLGELELIEPELWFRREPSAAEKLAAAIKRHKF